jgi:hypothetical protein
VATRVGGITEQMEGSAMARLVPPEAKALGAALVALAAEQDPFVAPMEDRWPGVMAALVRDLAGVLHL